MRKDIKTCIYVVTAILPIILSACSNKTEANNTLKDVKQNKTTLLENKSDITNTTVETTTEEDTTELIYDTEQDTLNSQDTITSQQQTQANIQQTTTVIPVNSTPVPIQNHEPPVVQTTPMPNTTTTPIPTDTSIPTETTTPEEYKNPSFVIKGIGEKYIYNDENGYTNIFTIDSANYAILDESYPINGYLSKIKLQLQVKISILENYSPVHCKYSIYNSDSICVTTGTVNFYYQTSTSKTASASFFVNDLPPDEYTIVFSNYE